MSDHEEESGSGFRIVDRRRFNADGSKRDDTPEPQTAAAPEPTPPPPTPAPSAPAPAPQAAPRPAPPSEDPRHAQQGSIDFISFVASLATNAMAAMGVLPPEMSGDLPVNLDLAREYVDIIGMLQEKTQGNLSREEDAAMKRVLTDLRMAYVEVTRAKSPGA